MSHAAPESEPPVADADPAVLRALFRLRVLEELTEAGLRLVRALERRVLAEAEAAASEPAPIEPAPNDPASSEPAPNDASGARAAKAADPAAAFASHSRAIRLTIALQGKIDEALCALESGVERTRGEARAKAAEEARAAAIEARDWRQLRIRTLVGMAAEREITDKEMLERLDTDVDERLGDSEAFWIDPERPLRDIVDHLCRCFGLTPDWSRWDGEAWIEEDQPPWPWGPSPLAIDKSDPFMPVTRYSDMTFTDYVAPAPKLPELE